jgi:hypothetical protein
MDSALQAGPFENGLLDALAVLIQRLLVGPSVAFTGEADNLPID